MRLQALQGCRWLVNRAVCPELSMGPFRVTQPNPIQLTMELTV